ncbi:MAG: cation-translocating P-type ATPase [Planctomycetota bacterium]
MTTAATGSGLPFSTGSTGDPAPPTPTLAGGSSERAVELKLIGTLGGGVILLCAILATFVFAESWQAAFTERNFYAGLLAFIAAIVLGIPILLGAGAHVLRRAGLMRSTRSETANFEELVAVAFLASFAAGRYFEASAVAFFMLLASFIEARTAVGARKTIESLIRITPTRANKLTGEGDGASEVEVDAATLQPGDRVIVRPGDNIPGDGTIRQGMSTIDQANITGESLPVEKGEGDDVFAGTINQTGVLTVEVTRAGKDSTLSKVQDLISQAVETRPAIVRLLDQYAGYYTPVVLMVAFIVFFFTKDLEKSISLILICCPVEVLIAGPTAMVAALSAAARVGVLVKSVGELEIARRVTAIVFDKTGTLTTGKLAVTRLQPADGVDGADLLRVAVSAEKDSRHPVAKAVLAIAKQAKVTPHEVIDFEEVAGRGVRCKVEGSTVMCGRETWLGEQGVDMSGLDAESGEGMSLLFVARDGKAIGWIGLEDKPRKDAAESLSQLEELGVKRRIMITGDRRSAAMRVARQVGITDVEAEALPGDKLELVKGLRAQGHTVAVVGDGVNDGPALAAGNVSIAMGAAGSDVAIHSASVALSNNLLNRIPFLISLSKQTMNVMRQTLIGLLIFIVAMLSLLAMGYINPLIAAAAHGVASLAVVFNSARLVRAGEDLDHPEPEEEKQSEPQRRVERVTPAAG